MEKKIIESYTVIPGNPEQAGVTIHEDGINFAVAVPEGQKAELIITNAEGKKKAEIPLPEQPAAGSLRAVLIRDLPDDAAGYYYLVKGRKELDPYAGLLGKDDCRIPDRKPAETVTEDILPDLRPEDLMIYKLHVKGFTKKAKIAAGLKGTFAGLGKMLPYIKGLGFNAVELMPAYEWCDRLRVQPFSAAREESGGRASAVKPVNYWGYSDVNYYFAPKRAYSADGNPCAEFRELVRACHAESMELYMEFYFPGGTDPALAHAALRSWKMKYHVDGFHLIGDGVPLDLVIRDPMLSRTKLMIEFVDADRYYRGTVPVRRNLMLCNDEFEHTGRAFLKGDEGQTGKFAALIRRNPSSHAVVNYMANVNGFTLFDSVSYDWKHNEENGEDNRDGTVFNYSWNCGAEGPSRRKNVRELRLRQIRNALMYVFLSQGTPLLYAGDEQLNTQKGNNNAYCCDNPVGWLDWSSGRDSAAMTEFVKELTAYRRQNRIFHMPGELKGTDYRSLGMPDISFHDSRAWMCSFENVSRTLAVMYNGLYTQKEDREGAPGYYYVVYNAYWNPYRFALPDLPKGFSWFLAADTGRSASFCREPELLRDQKYFEAAERTVCILEGRPGGEPAAEPAVPEEAP